MLTKMTRWLRHAFTEKADAKPALAETATLDTRHGPVRMDRAVLSCGSVAYLCHTASKPENAVLDIDCVEYVYTDRNTGEAHDANNVMSEASDDGYKSDFYYAAEGLCNAQNDMGRAMVVVFFDHGAKSVDAAKALQELRQRFPATSPARDRLERPQDSLQKPARPVEPTVKRTVTYQDCGLCG